MTTNFETLAAALAMTAGIAIASLLLLVAALRR